jgi:hypothetical protein
VQEEAGRAVLRRKEAASCAVTHGGINQFWASLTSASRCEVPRKLSA